MQQGKQRKHKRATSKVKKTTTSNERSNVALKRTGPASLFCREAEMLFGALKTKSCLSDSEFFLFSGEKYRSRQKSADGEFSLFRFFCSCKRNEMPLRQEQQRSAKIFAAIKRKSQFSLLFCNLFYGRITKEK